MSRPLRHPWWLHLPTLLALAVCIAVPPLTRPWPPRPRGYTWEDWAMPVALLIVLLAWEVAASELWIRAENGRKRFNRYLLWPAGLGGWMAGIQIGIYWARLQGITPQSTIYAAGGAAFCLAGTAILECLRRPLPQVPAAPCLPTSATNFAKAIGGPISQLSDPDGSVAPYSCFYRSLPCALFALWMVVSGTLSGLTLSSFCRGF